MPLPRPAVMLQIPQIVASHQSEIHCLVSGLTQVHETINTSIPQKSGGSGPIAERCLILSIVEGVTWAISYRAGKGIQRAGTIAPVAFVVSVQLPLRRACPTAPKLYPRDAS
ncbi:hypothetical protein SNOG_09724 [Parastagonospora nodorum SN15]|uniref:Uncharacterized protein n=1 Tax=Phaeosphaeria nodorum (strain SN15 / ATCC MYA-4574 / FGSC 10173) TaxID=321614 RepID=Q0UEU0_PHANO|nr:hypothetical protein SNOG_09724 [Parastagonospora nodorum SN15]KAH3946636.1 hypothetical protein HBH53_127870 [Parastagonospora nodorum]EAT82989.1 hypothetical protein SNOG_09724 [Parastagonospora nodorum SN15]KAH3978373.1 hypothetical protein HBH52_105890 [Parastagonospora nodorum]KAH4001479.1 hypothetical protein HBI10_087590 [Parastagonospora nodorum]KAH4027268.1 hypothetical protein HBI13_056610 [Parastagonospora nodorum]